MLGRTCSAVTTLTVTPSRSVVPQEFIAEADTVVTLGEMSGTYNATGKSFKTPFVHIWRFSADRLQSFSAHMDTLVYQRALQ